MMLLNPFRFSPGDAPGQTPQVVVLTTEAVTNWEITDGGKLATVAAGAAADLWHKVCAANPKSAGKWYAEFVMQGGGAWAIGVAIGGTSTSSGIGDPNNAGSGGRYQYFTTGKKRASNTYENYGASYAAGDVIGIALDADANTLTAYKNGASQGVMYSSLTMSYELHLCVYGGAGTAIRVPEFATYLPAGYSAWAD